MDEEDVKRRRQETTRDYRRCTVQYPLRIEIRECTPKTRVKQRRRLKESVAPHPIGRKQCKDGGNTPAAGLTGRLKPAFVVIDTDDEYVSRKHVTFGGVGETQPYPRNGRSDDGERRGFRCVLTSNGQGSAMRSSQAGHTRSAITSAAVYYSCTDVRVGQSYTVTVSWNRLTFDPPMANVNGVGDGLDFTAQPIGRKQAMGGSVRFAEPSSLSRAKLTDKTPRRNGRFL